MRVDFSLPPCIDSPLASLDARWRLASLLVTIAVVACLRSLVGLGLMAFLVLLLACLARLPVRWFLRRLGATAGLVAVFVLPLPFLVRDGGPVLELGPLGLSWAGCRLGLLIAGKAAAIVTLACILLTTCPLDHTLKAAHRLRIPGLLIHLAVMSYRYTFLLADELASLRQAVRVRGFRARIDAHTYRTVGAITGTLLVCGFERAERVGQAMRCRGFDGTFRSLAEFHTRSRDILFFLFIQLVCVGMLWQDGFFRHG